MFKFFCFSDLTSNTTCTEGDIRLVLQSNDEEGVLQICLFDEWVTSCFNSDINSATTAAVACAQLGLPTEGGKRDRVYD